VFPVEEILLFGVLAGGVAAAALWLLWRWSRQLYRFAIAGSTTTLGWLAWNFTLNATQAVPNFDVDAPVVRISWADVGSGLMACLVTVLVLGLITDRGEPAQRVVGAAAIAGVAALVVDLFVL
jgi:hypothetical protein